MIYISKLGRVEALSKTIQLAFGEQELTHTQLWALVKLSKHVRLRARNNAAFNNLFSALFPYATFKQVTKIRKDGSSYPGLSITCKDSNMPETETEEEEE